MEAVKKELGTTFPNVKVELHQMDFSKQYQAEDFQKVYKKIENLDISILVNNVDYADGNVFNELSENSVHTMMVVNCYAMALLSKLVLSSFERRWTGGQKKSLIVNHCAGASIAPMPYVQMYSATKV